MENIHDTDGTDYKEIKRAWNLQQVNVRQPRISINH